MDEFGAWDFDAKVKQILGKLNIHQLAAKRRHPKRRSTQTGGSGQNAY